MATHPKKQISTILQSEAAESQNIFEDGRLVLQCGEDIQMTWFQQENESGRNFLTLHQNLLSFVIQGRKEIWHERGKLTVNPTEGFFLQRGAYLRSEKFAGAQHRFATLAILISDSFLHELPGGNHTTSPQHALHLYTDNLINGLVAQCQEYFLRPADKERIEAILPYKVRELLLLLASCPQNPAFGSILKGGPVQEESGLPALMEAHFRESLQLEQWAFLAGLSLSSFKRKFMSLYQQPPGRWIQQRRLQEAWQLLGEGRLNVTEVCYEVGFENLAHFVHAFREQYRITPKQRQLKATEKMAMNC